MSEEQRQCNVCNEWFPKTSDYFQCTNKNRGWWSGKCLKCLREGYNKYDASHREERSLKQKERRANESFQKREKEYIHKYRTEHAQEIKEKRRQYEERNHDRIRERSKEYNKKRYRELHPERSWKPTTPKSKEHRREAQRQWRANNPEKVRQYNATTRTRERQKTWRNAHKEQARLHCLRHKARKRHALGSHTLEDIHAQYRRQKGKCYYCHKSVGTDYHVDHVVPLSRGGSDDISNIVIACSHCNCSKHNKLPHEWGDGGRLL